MDPYLNWNVSRAPRIPNYRGTKLIELGRCNPVDESINLEHGDIVVLAVFECWKDSIRFSKMDIAIN